MIVPEKERLPCLLPHLPGRPRAVNAREGLGTLSAGQAWKMAARWHELVRTQERAHSTMVRLINFLERG